MTNLYSARPQWLAYAHKALDASAAVFTRQTRYSEVIAVVELLALE